MPNKRAKGGHDSRKSENHVDSGRYAPVILKESVGANDRLIEMIAHVLPRHSYQGWTLWQKLG